MSAEIIIVLIVLLFTVILFITELIPVDLVALSAMGILIVVGILSPEEGILGFSNSATVTIAAMFVLSAGMFKTGVVNYLGRLISRIFQYNFWAAIFFLMLIVGVISAFINNTPVVAIFLPILLKVAATTERSASKLLMPLSYASVFGGVCTLIGTSTNILVSSIAVQYGQAPFSMFEFTHLGVIFFLAGLLYMIFIGVRLIPERRTETDLTNSYGLNEYLTEIIVKEESGLTGKELRDTSIVKELGVDVIEIIRNNRRIFLPSPSTQLVNDDVLRIKCDLEKIKELQEKTGVLLKPGLKWKDDKIENKDVVMVEAVISPNSFLTGKTLKQINFRNRFDATALAIRHRGRVMYENVSGTRLLAGDALLIEVKRENLDRLRDNEAFVVISEIDPPTFKKSKIIFAILIITGVVLAATFNFLPISAAAITGSILLVITGCISLEQAYRSIDWQIIMLLAGSIALGFALEKTGAAKLISDFVISLVGNLGPVAILSAFYILTLVLTEAMSNNATAALITPIAIVTAGSLGVDPKPFLVTVMFAASLAFMLPVGYQTHLIIFNPGRYKTIDFIKVGTPLNILFWLLATLLIPLFFPF